jgi:SNF2 family DNA or RNA helicase
MRCTSTHLTPHTHTATLLPYQKQGLHWLWTREQTYNFPLADLSLTDPPTFLFWLKARDPATQREVYFNTINKEKRSYAPDLFKGGILADDMGCV